MSALGFKARVDLSLHASLPGFDEIADRPLV